MKRYFWMMIPLLALTVSLFLPKGAGAYPETFPRNDAALEVIAEVNALRASKGLLPYQVDSVLMTVAQSHAQYQASTGVLTHYGVDGSRPHQRAIAAGYPVAGDLSSGGFFSENIYSGENVSAADVVKIWQANSSDLAALISSDFKDIGVGVAVENGIVYYTLDVGLSTEDTNADTTSVPKGAATSSTPGEKPVFTSTPLADGSIYHEVQSNEALWSIALAYDLTVDELKKINRLATNDIFIGQKLLIKSARQVLTATPTPISTATFGIPTSTSTRLVTPVATSTATLIPVPPASRKDGGMMVAAIIFIALFAAGLGAWLGRKKNNIVT